MSLLSYLSSLIWPEPRYRSQPLPFARTGGPNDLRDVDLRQIGFKIKGQRESLGPLKPRVARPTKRRPS